MKQESVCMSCGAPIIGGFCSNKKCMGSPNWSLKNNTYSTPRGKQRPAKPVKKKMGTLQTIWTLIIIFAIFYVLAELS